MKRNKGITLIALVITIIVLLILAGVAISMLSGENGILRKAAEAKTETEKKSLEEQIKLAVIGATEAGTSKVDKQKVADELGIDRNSINGDSNDIVLTKDEKTYNLKNGKLEEVTPIKEIDNELDEAFQEKNLTYKCRYGYITGVDVNIDNNAETAEKLNQVLNSKNYKLINIENTADVTNETPLTTGMAVTKENETTVLARVVILGDTVGAGTIGGSSQVSTKLFLYEGTEDVTDWSLVAMNIVVDNYIDEKNDYNALKLRIVNTHEKKSLINQSQYAKDPTKLIYTTRKKVIQDYMDNLPNEFKESTKYSFEENKKKNPPYILNVAEGEANKDELLKILPKNTEINIEDYDEDTNIATYSIEIVSELFDNIQIATYDAQKQ